MNGEAGLSVADFRRGMICRLLTIREAREDFLKRPEDPEAVHRLRVSLRQARSLLSLLKSLLKGGKSVRIRAGLRSLSHAMAPLRELDVLREAWEDYAAQHGKSADGGALAAALRTARESEKAPALQAMRTPEAQKVLRRALAWVDGWDDKYGRKTDLLPAAARTADSWSRRIGEGLARLDVNDLEGSHRLRIAVKKLRYALECVPIRPDASGLSAARLRELQEDLGILCDTHIHLRTLCAPGLLPESAGTSQSLLGFADFLKGLREDAGARIQSETQPAAPGAAPAVSAREAKGPRETEK